MTFEEKLAQAFKETFDERAERLMNVEKKHRFSLAYRLWERKMLRDIRKDRVSKRWTLKRARAVVAVGITAAALLIGGTAFAAVNLGRYSFVDKREYSRLFIENISSDKTVFEEYYGLPEEDGWVMENYDISDSFTVLNYKRGEKKITFGQDLIQGYAGNVDTENAEIEPMSIYEENDGFFIEFQNGGCGLWWIYDGYLFSIVGDIDKSELINLAHSTKIVDF